jgi:hypothetical protein
MNMKILPFLCVLLLLCSCTRKVADPVREPAASFEIVNCDEADEFFTAGPTSLAKPHGYYACACPSENSDTVTIIVYLPEEAWLDVIIRNATGYDLRNYGGEYGAGTVQIKWDRKSKKGKRVKPGIYIIHLAIRNGYEADAVMLLE